MRKLSILTRVYIICTLAAGSILLVASLSRSNLAVNGLLTLVLTVLGTVSLILKVEGTTNRTHYNISFLIYGFTLILLGAPQALIVILVSHIVEWIWHKYPWYIQAFNLGSYIIVAVAANLFYEFINPSRSLGTWEGAFSILLAMTVFTLGNHLMVGMIVWLARGENFQQSGIFQFFPLVLDLILLSLGAGSAVIWAYNPPAVILVLLPIYLIYTTLRVPALERQTEIDLKTGVFNHHYLMTSLESELARANKFERPLTMVMADLDLLRNINNTYGHLAGDEVLIGVAKILKESARDYDIVSRFGGEEFAILMPETTPQAAYPIVEKMRQAIASAQFVVPTSVTPISATMSFGISGREKIQESRGLIHNADMALYHAKLRGRNRAFIYNKDGFDVLFHTNQRENEEIDAPIPYLVGDQPITTKKNGVLNTEVPTRPRLDLPPEVIKAANEAIKQRRELHSHQGWANAYIAALGILAAVILIRLLSTVTPVDWVGVAVFAILVAATEWSSIDIYVRNTAVSVSAVPLIAAILLFGPTGAVVMALAVATVALIKHRSPFSRFVFNASNQFLAGMACILIIQTSGIPFTEWSVLVQLISSPFMGLVVYLITSFCVAIGIHLSMGAPLRQVWVGQFSWLAPYYLAMGLMAYTLIYSYQHSGLSGTVVILLPLVLLRLSQKQFIDRTRDAVSELKNNNKILEERSAEITRLNDGLLATLAEVIDLRDPYVLGHSQQVTRYAVLIAEQLGLGEYQIEVIRKASLMHDVGKLGIHESILSKPSSLNIQEFEAIKRHVTVGADLLRKSQALQSLVPIVLHHHERYDGKGYPDGLKGDEIPMEARIVCLADAVEAMSSNRPYRQSLGLQDVVKEVKRCSGSQFDPRVVRAFELVAAQMGEKLLRSPDAAPSETAVEKFSGKLKPEMATKPSQS